MLKALDIVIGLAWIMVVVSMAVTVISQGILAFLNTRGSCLKRGIQDLLQLLDNGISTDDAKEIADCILRDPLVAQPSLLGDYRLASEVHREELVKLILGFAAGVHRDDKKYSNLRKRVQESLDKNGIGDPGSVLGKVRNSILELESAKPELANYQRLNIALLEHASSDFLGKLYGWFDQTIDRVSARFTLGARLATALAAIVVAIALQLDTIALVNRLSTNDDFRKAMVTAAQDHPEKFQPSQKGTTPSIGDNSTKTPTTTDVLNDPDFRSLVGLDIFPKSWDKWRDWSGTRVPGVILSVLLLSLGAPFWYEMLKKLLKLRSVLASKDDAQREERQTTQTANTNTAAPSSDAVALPQGERGDLNAIG